MQEHSRLLSISAQLQKEEVETQERLVQIRDDLSAIKRAIFLWERDLYGERQPDIESDEALIAAIKSSSYPEAAVLIAKAHGGRVRPSQDKTLLVKAGLTIGTVRAYRQLTATLVRMAKNSGKFQRVAPGEYELGTA